MAIVSTISDWIAGQSTSGGYGTRRLNSAIGYITPQDMLDGKRQAIFDERNRKLAEAREKRRAKRAERRESTSGSRLDAASHRAPVDFADIRAQLPILTVLEHLGFQPQSHRGAQLRGACPFHATMYATSRCFSANTDTNVFHCFRCGKKGDVIDLWQLAQRLTPYDAAIDLCQQFQLRIKPEWRRGTRAVVENHHGTG